MSVHVASLNYSPPAKTPVDSSTFDRTRSVVSIDKQPVITMSEKSHSTISLIKSAIRKTQHSVSRKMRSVKSCLKALKERERTNHRKKQFLLREFSKLLHLKPQSTYRSLKPQLQSLGLSNTSDSAAVTSIAGRSTRALLFSFLTLSEVKLAQWRFRLEISGWGGVLPISRLYKLFK